MPRTTPRSAAVALAILLPLGLLVPLASLHAEGAPAASGAAVAASATASPGTGAAASASASASSLAAKRPPLFSEDLPPPEKSPMPKAAEWKTATAFRFNHGLRSTCDAERVREWVRLICHETGTIIAPLAGPTEGFVGNVLSPSRAMPVPNYHLIIFPVRRGERRLIEVHPGAVGGYDDTLWVGQSWYLSSQWNEGEEPILTAQNR